MPHCDLDDLALLALGEPVGPQVSGHAENCPICAAQLEELREVVTIGRASGGPDALVEPPAEVWERIDEQMRTEPVPLRPRRRWIGVAAAAVAGVLIGAGTVAMVDGQDTGRLVASAALAPMPEGPDRGATAEATVNETPEGYTVTVAAQNLPGAEGFYEVWLLDPVNAGLVALGTLSPGQKEATFPVPDGVDLQVFTSVDISDEPLDGDPTHSKLTVLRGTLA